MARPLPDAGAPPAVHCNSTARCLAPAASRHWPHGGGACCKPLNEAPAASSLPSAGLPAALVHGWPASRSWSWRCCHHPGQVHCLMRWRWQPAGTAARGRKYWACTAPPGTTSRWCTTLCSFSFFSTGFVHCPVVRICMLPFGGWVALYYMHHAAVCVHAAWNNVALLDGASVHVFC